jgi:hypothetical protein
MRRVQAIEGIGLDGREQAVDCEDPVACVDEVVDVVSVAHAGGSKHVFNSGNSAQ